MRILLLKDVEQNGQVKTTVRRKTRTAIAWFAGTEIEVSDTTGQKFIESGDAKQVAVAVEEAAVAAAEG